MIDKKTEYKRLIKKINQGKDLLNLYINQVILQLRKSVKYIQKCRIRPIILSLKIMRKSMIKKSSKFFAKAKSKKIYQIIHNYLESHHLI